eukprot:10275461-Alexandrium_andersonii.AAC.1
MRGPPVGRPTTVGWALAFASWRPPFVPTLRFVVALRPHQGPLAAQGAPPHRHDRITRLATVGQAWPMPSLVVALLACWFKPGAHRRALQQEGGACAASFHFLFCSLVFGCLAP